MIGRFVFRRVLVCFACGKRGHRPCSGHEYGGMIYGRQMRWAFRWLLRRAA